jgi:hypothetical protein
MRGKIILFCEYDRETTPGQISGDPGAVDPPANNEYITRQVS